MADSKISALTALSAAPASGDLLVLVDVSDTTMAASGTDKKITYANLTSAVLAATGATTGATSQAQTFTNGVLTGAGTAAAPGIAIVGDTDTGITQLAANTLSIATGGTERVRINSSGSVGIGGSNFGARLTIEGGNILIDNGYGFQAKDSGGTQRTLFNYTSGNNLQFSNTATTGNIQFLSNNAVGAIQFNTDSTNRLYIAAGGNIGVGNITSPTALLHVAASTTARASVCVVAGTAPTTPVVGDIWNDGALSFYNADATTNAIVNHLRLSRDSTGTAAAGLGLGILAELESTTTSRQSAGRLTWEWATATHASRAAKGKLTAYYTSTEREAITWVADSTGVNVGISTSAPETTLHVDGTNRPFDAPGGIGIFQDDSDRQIAIGGLGMFRRDGDIDDGASLRLNYIGYNGGTTRFRDTVIYNGKTTQTAFFDGSTGWLGLGNIAPQGLLHGHDGSGGFLFVNQASVGGTLVTVIPDAAGDVTEKIFFVGWCTNSAPFSADVAPTTLTVSSSTTKTDGTNTLTIAVTAGGAFTLQATGGAATWNVNLWVFWR